MKQWTSRKWRWYAERPTTILLRCYRSSFYLAYGTVTGLPFSAVLNVGERGTHAVFVRQDEYLAGLAGAARDLRTGRFRHVLRRLSAIARERPAGAMPLERAFTIGRRLGPSPLYSQYLEPILTERLQRTGRLSKQERRFIRWNGQFRVRIIRLLDVHYRRAVRQLQKETRRTNIEWYTFDELRAGKKLSQRDIRSRRTFNVLLVNRHGQTVYTNAAAKRFLAREGLRRRTAKDAHALQGVPAYPGTVTGTVRIARTHADLSRLPRDAVVVSPMVTTQFFPFLRSVRAMVTEDGGLTCHAATIAREFRIPCIVGTKIATQVLKNGDRVTVDATNGVVRTLNVHAHRA